jgi:hypothetical protein
MRNPERARMPAPIAGTHAACGGSVAGHPFNPAFRKDSIMTANNLDLATLPDPDLSVPIPGAGAANPDDHSPPRPLLTSEQVQVKRDQFDREVRAAVDQVLSLAMIVTNHLLQDQDDEEIATVAAVMAEKATQIRQLADHFYDREEEDTLHAS